MDRPKLNPQQRKAVNFGNGPLLIIAGAGTGKTTVITQRIQDLIMERKILPKNILALTFTEKAAKEMQERTDIALPYGYSDMWIHTFHGFCDRVLRSDGLAIGLATNYSLLTEAQSILFLRNHIFDLQLSYFRPLGNPDKFLQGLLQHFSRLKDEDVSPDEYKQFIKKKYAKKFLTEQEQDEKERFEELATAYDIYQTLKGKESVVDFGDLISHTLALFRRHPNILKNYQQQFKYVLIDEFQDTNFAQNQLALLLANSEQNISVVGDDDQAIYRWRGAAISNMMQFTKHFPKAKIITLTENYRSSQVILDTAYKVIQHNNPDRLELKEHIDKHLIAAAKKANHPPTFIFRSTDVEEAESVVEKIQQLHEKGYEYKDFAILVRANDHAAIFLRAFEQKGIPHQFLGPGKLFHKDEIKNLIAYLKVLYNKEDTSSLYRVITMPLWNIPAQDIADLLHASKKMSKTLFEVLIASNAIVLTENGQKGLKKIKQLFVKHMDLVPRETAGRILYDFLEESELMRKLLIVPTHGDEIKAQNISKFFDKLKQFEAHNDNASVYAVVDWLDLSMQLGESPLATEIDWSEHNAVNILTIHASKGLEFPVVFITDLVAQRFPSREKSEQIPIPDDLIKEILPQGDYHLQEERRLFYVALTRAKEYVFLTAARNYGEGKLDRKISPFVIEAVGENAEEKDADKSTETPTYVLRKADESTSQIFKPSPLTISYISYSQIQSFDICPLHYKLKYLLHVPTSPSAAVSFGTSIHAALKEFYAKALKGETVQIQSMEKLLSSVWVSEGFVSKKHTELAFASALKMITLYLKENFNNKQLPLEVEFPFRFKIGNLSVGGRIDRIENNANGSLEIIDYKTGRLQEGKNLKNNLQLALYGLAAQSIPSLKNDNTIISLHYIETGQKISTTLGVEDLKKASEKIIAKVKEIESSTFLCSKSIFCKDCEYKMICEVNQ